MKSISIAAAVATLASTSVLPVEANASETVWRPLGATFEGTGLDAFGFTVDIDDVGDTVAIGAPAADDGKGAVLVFDWNGSDRRWEQRGDALVGQVGFEDSSPDLPGDFFGLSLDLSADGNTIAVVSPGANDLSGRVEIYDWDSEAWIQRGVSIEGAPADGLWSVALADDGETVAIGAFSYFAALLSESPDLEFTGHVAVYDWVDEEGWTQRGVDLAADEVLTGWSVAIADDGDSIALSLLSIPGDGGIGSGTVVVVDWDDDAGEWVPRGSVQDGVSFFATSLSLSNDGQTLGFLGYFVESEESALAVVMDWEDEEWIQRGEGIPGETFALELFFSSTMKMTPDGRTLAITNYTEPGSESDPPPPGSVSVHDWGGGEWIRRPKDIQPPRGLYPFSVAINADGDRLVNGQVQTYFGSGDDSQVVVYQETRRSSSKPPRIDVTLDPAGGSCTGHSGPWTISRRGEVVLPTSSECSRDGHVFLGWSPDPSNWSPGDSLPTTVSTSVELRAMWGALPAAPAEIGVLANFFCGPCETALVYWPSPDVDIDVVLTVDESPASCAESGEAFGYQWCRLNDLESGAPHTVSVAFRNDYGNGSTATSRFVLN